MSVRRRICGRFRPICAHVRAGNPTFKERTIVGVSDNDDDDNCSNINVNINNNGSNGRTKLMIDTRPAEEIGSPGCGGDKHALATADKGKEAAPLLREISPAKEKDKAMSLSSSRNSSGSTDSVSSQVSDGSVFGAVVAGMDDIR